MQITTIIFWLVLLSFLLLFLWLGIRFNLLKDKSTATVKPYSYARVQLTWWTLIIVSSFVSIFLSKGNLPLLDSSIIILLGLSSATTATAAVIDTSDQSNSKLTLIQNQESEGFLLDILSDNNGISIHRLQAFLFNIIIGVWVLYSVQKGLLNCNVITNQTCINTIIPSIDDNKLLLLGVSALAYVGLKTNENK
jgi:hypothetical protein